MVTFAHTLDALQSATTRRELWDISLRFYLDNGISRVSYHAAETNDHRGGIKTFGFDPDWVCHYIEGELIKVDPIPALAATSSKPFFWSEAALLVELTPEHQAYLKELAGSVSGDGLAFTAFGPKLRNAYIGLGFAHQRERPTAEQILQFQTVAQMGHLKWCQITEEKESPNPRLSRRELETIEWVARGKSNSDIAGILGISPHTVDTLMRRIYEKLGVRDRTSAAIKAVGSGLLQYHDPAT
ncbi:MAG: autoinducer binding domain-containing protein [Pseudomonadota bacterium]